VLQVSYIPDHSTFRVKCNYAPDYVRRLRRLQGARFDRSTSTWSVPLDQLGEFENLFRGEIVYSTPRFLLTGEPDLDPGYYSDVRSVDEIETRLPLYQFQKFGASFLAQRAVEHGFAFLCDETGIGKSAQALGARLLLMNVLARRDLKTLIACPAAVRRQWVVNTVPKFLDSASMVEVCGKQKERLALYGSADISVVNYEALMRDASLLLKKLKFGLVILDEAQRLKNRTGKTHKAVFNMLKKMGRPYVFFLTATPVMNDLDELYALFRLGDPNFFGTYTSFRDRYMRVDYSAGYPRLIGYRNLDELNEKVGPFILRRTSQHPEVASSLPDLVVQNYYVEPSPVQKEVHAGLYADWVKATADCHATRSWTDREQAEALCRGLIVMMQGVADHPHLLLMTDSKLAKPYQGTCRLARGSPKLDQLCELVDDIAPDNKVVIFTQFERMARLIHKALSKYNPALYAGTNLDTREGELERFRTDPLCRVIVITDAGGTGIDLQVARHLINFDLPWSPGQLDQRYGRIKRFGSAYDTIFAINLVMSDLIDERILQALERKEDVFKAVVTATNSVV